MPVRRTTWTGARSLTTAMAVCLAALAVGASGAGVRRAPGHVHAGQRRLRPRVRGPHQRGARLLGCSGQHPSGSGRHLPAGQPQPLRGRRVRGAQRPDARVLPSAFTDPTPPASVPGGLRRSAQGMRAAHRPDAVGFGDPFSIGIPELVPPPAGTFTAVALSKEAFPTTGVRAVQRADHHLLGFVPSPGPPAGTFTALDITRSGGCAVRTDQTVACWH